MRIFLTLLLWLLLLLRMPSSVYVDVACFLPLVSGQKLELFYALVSIVCRSCSFRSVLPMGLLFLML